MKKKNNPPIEQYQTIGWPQLEAIVARGCPCCDKPFTATNRVDMISRCHPHSPVTTDYFDGYLYLTCGQCDKPIVRIPVSKSLL